MTSPNHYAVLGVLRFATHAEIKAAYNRLVLQAHPDKGGSPSDFIKIQAAWEVLRDTSARAEFDRKIPFATGVPGQPQSSRGKSPRGAESRSGERKSSPGSRHSHPAGGNTGPSTKPNSHRWSGYRESAGGNAYNNYHGFSAKDTDDGVPKSRSRPTNPEGASAKQHHTRGRDEPSPKDTPMADPPDEPKPERPSHERSHFAGVGTRNSHARGRQRSPSPAPDHPRGRWSPPGAAHTEMDIKPIQDLADKAARNLKSYKELLEVVRFRTSSHPLTQLSEEMHMKLRHVQCCLSAREMKIKLRVYAIMNYNAEVRARQTTTPLESFYPSLIETILDTDMDNVSDLNHAMGRVLRDTAEMVRVKQVLDSKAMKLTDGEKSVRNWRSSIDALARLLTKILTSSFATVA
ncbi:hypothetical protein A1O7_03815 [Cladophialophora yegresii CBS 114405]|uniref:J domain-containing protein n=1 Tax=Cladophialophora yegresii CBS 114405 TaxID=1182544 RepID=W9WMJ3_9EURO|nr:uncharacterized protein A1O7_03815 [Cladophialophora yegresii CBS 114405]EXJ59669.1 hypothetical protein A1O7_03815 [Cladophialophora yegresii CBS 114405]